MTGSCCRRATRSTAPRRGSSCSLASVRSSRWARPETDRLAEPGSRLGPEERTSILAESSCRCRSRVPKQGPTTGPADMLTGRPTRAMRLTQLQDQIGRGEYRVDPQAVALAILRRLLDG